MSPPDVSLFYMPVFQIRTLPSSNDRVMDIIGETFDAIGAREIKANRWLLVGTPAEIQKTFARLGGELPEDVVSLTELCKSDLEDQGQLSDDEISLFRSQAADKL